MINPARRLYQQHQHEHDNERAFDEVVADGTDGPVHKFFAVQKGSYLNAFGQTGRNFRQPCFYKADYLCGVFTFEHHDDTEYNFPLTIVRNGAIPERMAEPHVRNVADF